MSYHKQPFLIRLLIRWLVWPVEAAGLLLLSGLFRLLPVRMASWLGGAAVRLLAPFSSWQRRAEQNLAHAMPELEADQRHALIRKMWWQTGRTAGEFFHASQLVRSGQVAITGLHHLTENAGGSILVGGHFGNWEIMPEAVRQSGREVGIIYRPLNNQLANWIFQTRQNQPRTKTFIKGREAALGMVATVTAGGVMLILADQQLREGAEVSFFGHPAQTAVSHIKVALRRKSALHMARTRRLPDGRLSLDISAPLDLPEGEEEEAVLALATRINQIFESWIREAPEQWLWPHRRWGRLD